MSTCLTYFNRDLWKLNEIASKKEGSRCCIYDIKCKRQRNEESIESQWSIVGSYTGEWSNDLRDGYGVQIFENGSKYEGEWKLHKRNGYGVYWIAQQQQNNGSAHEDEDAICIFNKTPIELTQYRSKNVNTLLQIKESLHTSKRNKACSKLHKQYEGVWKNDLKHGKGTFYYQNGDKFEGMFSDDLRSGYGIMYYGNGDKYEGDWKFNKKNGFGIYTNKKEGNIYVGYWMNNKKEGPGHYRYDEKNKLYVAEWINNAPHCGYFVNINDIDYDVDNINASQKKIIPQLGLINADSVLATKIKKIREDRKLIRELTLINHIDALFQTEHEIKNKIIDIFEEIADPMNAMHTFSTQPCYVNKQSLYESIQDFEIPQLNRKQLMSQIAKHCHDLGIQKSDHSKHSHSVFILTLLDFAKIIYLLLH